MSEKTYTEKDVVLREREAFVAGATAVFDAFGIDPWNHRIVGEWKGMECMARARYPLPKVTRARVVQDPEGDGYWVICSGLVRWTMFDNGAGGIDLTNRSRPELLQITPKRVALWADLLANPTEECEA
ncbi:MAG: hypothetical protein EKK62_17025 [Acidimicrobiia bacterium]|nr:MAG: hypothetical protein EKK62_17025 [Acidimicrobiia bacterium]